jgi:hypothetical protein
MKKPPTQLLSYLSAFVIGAILFATFWKWIFGAASSIVVVAGLVGVITAVIIFLVWNEFKKPEGDED